jgi:hypothetical protein
MISITKAVLSFVFCICLASCDFLSGLERKNSSISIDRKLNIDYPFEINDCHILYKGKRLDFNVPIEDWTDILGRYERHPEGISTHYIWDSLGLLVRLSFNRKTVTGIEWFYNREMALSVEEMSNPKNYISGMRGVKNALAAENSWPKGRFSQSIRLDGILMDSQFNIHELNQARIKEGLNPFLESMWGNEWVHQRKCNGVGLNFSVDPNDDDESKLDSMSFGISWLDSENEKQ